MGAVGDVLELVARLRFVLPGGEFEVEEFYDELELCFEGIDEIGIVFEGCVHRGGENGLKLCVEASTLQLSDLLRMPNFGVRWLCCFL